MQNIVFERLREGQSINRWNLSEPAIRLFPGVPRPMTDKVDYRFVNGWVDTGDLPCREAWREHILERTVALSDVSFPHVHCGYENPRVDFSCFCFQPTVVGRWARCKLQVATAQILEFRVRTCGGLFAWCDGKPCLAHEPYTRNSPADARLTLPVSSGSHEITVYADDLHERDTTSFFQFQLVSGTEVSTGMCTQSDPARLSEIENMMAGLRTDRIFYDGGVLRVTSDSLPEEPAELVLITDDALPAQQSASDSFNSRHTGRQITVQLGKSCPFADVIDVDNLKSGCPEFIWQCTLGDVAVQSRIGTSVLTQAINLSPRSATQRRRVFLQSLADNAFDMPVYSLVMTSLNQWNDHAQNNFKKLLDIVNARDDCADFHIMPLVWMASRFSERLSPDNKQLLGTTLLGFRYWLDEPGNDVMWFWSENHVLCFHVAQYIAGDLYPDHEFSNSGKSGKLLALQALTRLHRWFDAVEEHGLAEWNSAAYYPIDLRGLLTLHQNGKDQHIVERARLLIDRIFEMTALHTLNGVPAGSQGRAYEKEILAGPATELGALVAVGFGGPWYPGHDTAAAMLAIADYVVPDNLDSFLRVPDGLGLSSCYFQGLDHHAELHLWKTSDIQLSTVCNQKPGAHGHQQHLLDLQFAGHPHARLWINHPGELRVWGDGRPSYWAGNGLLPRVAHHEDCATMIFDLSVDCRDIAFTHLFCPADIMDEIIKQTGNWLFARCAGGYAGVFCNGDLEPQTRGLYAGSEWRLNKLLAAWVVITGSQSAYHSFDEFMRVCLSRQVVFCEHNRTLTLLARDRKSRLSVSYSSGLLCNGQSLDNSVDTHIPKPQFIALA